MSASRFDKKFNDGKDITQHLDLKSAKVNKKIQRVNVDFPVALLKKIDTEAQKMGVARTALIKVWLAERLGHA
ncbi:MAG: BrnA antitoxin family protein [Candidatus Omnitrophica bacterium]|nr:BrnA antitoxin family protein [Candidatus Omnitrophota bacterium]MBU1128906.1 BrnA antitoxin family protein [Candidatus Omnitrophota bacterium]MBU1784202.1 BrnA antitoxin family protein [Candidatus Omnitrophota bacterium]MBU1852031.1 BrnA antitoxin family protein [Candidatus Omnitrophota bacterium]